MGVNNLNYMAPFGAIRCGHLVHVRSIGQAVDGPTDQVVSSTIRDLVQEGSNLALLQIVKAHGHLGPFIQEEAQSDFLAVRRGIGPSGK